MIVDKNPPESSEGETTPEATPAGENENPILRQFEELQNKHKNQSEQLKRVMAEVKSYRDERQAKEAEHLEKAEKGKDWETVVRQLQKKLEESESYVVKTKQSAVVGDILQVASEFTTRPDIVADLLVNKFEAHIDDAGRVVARLKGELGEFTSTKDFIKAYVEEKVPELKKSFKAQGTGVPKPRNEQTESLDFNKLTPEQIKNMSSEDRKKLGKAILF